jgi:non-ribosomal peptide synthetase component F
MEAIDAGALVIVHCREPKEKMWGVLLRLDAIGVVVRGLDLASVEDWLRQERAGDPALIGPSTVFLPTHRILRVDLDETGAAVQSCADRFAEACGRDAREALLGGRR